MFRRLVRFLLPLLILAGCGSVAWWLYSSRPEKGVRTIKAPVVRVEGTTLKQTVYPVIAASQGTVMPRTRTVLTSEVGGRVLALSDNFRPGSFFKSGELLVKLDPGDYETAVVMAKATLASAQSNLVEEEAKAEQALESWRALGRTAEPSAMVLRAPQVARAKAEVAAADAQLAKAERDLERTEIRPLYDGQVLQQRVDVGQVISAGLDLGEVFSVDSVEVRLPLPERERPHIFLPQRFRDREPVEAGSAVTFRSTEGGMSHQWEGRLVRVEGAVDSDTRQTIAVARIEDPFGFREEGRPPLKIGQFLEAEIQGRTLENVFILPRTAVRAGNEIILIDPDNRLRRAQVRPVAGDTRHLVVAANEEGGPKDGDVLCTTPIPFPADGALVLPTIDGQLERPGVAESQGATTPPPSKKGKGKS